MIVVVDYDPEWPKVFELLSKPIWRHVKEIAESIEHVGSTAVPGLASKPVVDMGLVVREAGDTGLAIERLEGLGYFHRGDLGIAGRQAFRSPADLPEHHLYAYSRDNLALRNHLVLRDYLRNHPRVAEEYGALKKRLAREHQHDSCAYTEAKTSFILQILAAAGFEPMELGQIRRENLA